MKTLLLILSAACYAQTAIQLDQIQAPAATGVRVLTVGADGKPAWAALGPGLELRGGQIVVTAAAVQSVTQTPFLLTVASDGSYVVPPGPAFYSKNGLVLIPGKDYRLEGGRLIPLSPWLPDAAVYQWQTRINTEPAVLAGLQDAVRKAGVAPQ